MLRHSDIGVTAARHYVENKQRSVLGFGHLLRGERTIILRQFDLRQILGVSIWPGRRPPSRIGEALTRSHSNRQVRGQLLDDRYSLNVGTPQTAVC
jgi:hypothetical protein